MLCPQSDQLTHVYLILVAKVWDLESLLHRLGHCLDHKASFLDPVLCLEERGCCNWDLSFGHLWLGRGSRSSNRSCSRGSRGEGGARYMGQDVLLKNTPLFPCPSHIA